MSSFDIFWDLFDNKKSRDKCQNKWFLMSVKDQQACMDSLPSYILSTPDRTYRKHPMTYLNQKSWNDTIYSTEDKVVLSKPKEQTLSSYEPEPYDRATGISFMREKLKKNYEKGTFIQDFGGVYTEFLKDFINIPGEIDTKLCLDVTEDAMRVRNRFEDPYTGNIKSDARDARLNWFLDQAREQGRDLSLEI